MFRPSLAICIAVSMAPLPLRADITAEGLLRIWQGDDGIAITEIVRDDGDMVLRDVTFRIGGAAYLAESVRLANRPDARVGIRIDAPVRLSGAGLPDEAVARIDLGSAEILADRQDGGGLSYDIAAPSVTATLSDAGPQIPDIDYRISGLDALFATDAADGGATGGTARAERVLARIALPGPAGATVDVRLDDVTTEAELSPAGDTERHELRTTFAAMEIAGDGRTPSGPATFILRSGEGEAGTEFAGGTQSTTFQTNDVRLSATGDIVPRDEADVTIGALRLAATLPAYAGGDPRPVALEIDGLDVAPTAAYWARLDPDGALGRDGMNLRLRLSGEARLPDAGEDPIPPGAVPHLSLDRLEMSGLGIDLTAEGAVAMPLSRGQASGEVVLTATGLLDAIGDLAQAGLLPPGPELGARMGLAFATVPDPEGEGLLTKLRFGPDGAVTLNGMSVR